MGKMKNAVKNKGENAMAQISKLCYKQRWIPVVSTYSTRYNPLKPTLNMANKKERREFDDEFTFFGGFCV